MSKLRTTRRETYREIVNPDEEVYGRVIQELGNLTFKCKCSDGIERLARLRGNMRDRVIVSEGDFVLIHLSVDIPNGPCKIVYRYSDEVPESCIRELSRD